MGPWIDEKTADNETLLEEFETACRAGDHEYAPVYKAEILRRLFPANKGDTARLREVLAFYADPATYDLDHLSKHGYIIIDKDGGQRARDALVTDAMFAGGVSPYPTPEEIKYKLIYETPTPVQVVVDHYAAVVDELEKLKGQK